MNAKEKFHQSLLKLNELVIQNESNPSLHQLDFDLLRDEVKTIYTALSEWQMQAGSGNGVEGRRNNKESRPEVKPVEYDFSPKENSKLSNDASLHASPIRKEEINNPEKQTKKTVSEIFAEKSSSIHTINDKFNATKPEIGDRMKTAPIKDLKSYIGLNRRAFFAEAFFSGDEDKMDEMIEQVSYMKNLEEAVSFVRRAIDFSHASATDAWREFTQLLQRRFALAQ